MRAKTIVHADGRRRTTRKQNLFLDSLRKIAYEEILVGLFELARDARHFPHYFAQIVRTWLMERGLDAEWMTGVALQTQELWRYGKLDDPYNWEFQLSEAEVKSLGKELGSSTTQDLFSGSTRQSITLARTSEFAEKLVERGIPYRERKTLHLAPLYVRPWSIDARFKIDPPTGLPRYEADVESSREYIRRCEARIDNEIRNGFFGDVEISQLTDARKGKLRTTSAYIDEQLLSFVSETDRYGNAVWLTSTRPVLNGRRDADLAVRYQILGQEVADIRRAISAERRDDTETSESSKMISASGINKAVSEYLAEIGLPKRPGTVGRRAGTTKDVLEARMTERINRELNGLN